MRTSVPKGPLYVEGGIKGDFEICKMFRDEATEITTWKNDESCFEPLQLNEGVLSDLQQKAMAAASRWE